MMIRFSTLHAWATIASVRLSRTLPDGVANTVTKPSWATCPLTCSQLELAISLNLFMSTLLENMEILLWVWLQRNSATSVKTTLRKRFKPSLIHSCSNNSILWLRVGLTVLMESIECVISLPKYSLTMCKLKTAPLRRDSISTRNCHFDQKYIWW